MRKALVATLALAALVAIALVGGQANAAQERQTSTLVGTGATFPFPLISKWIPEVGKAYGIDLTYSPTGSGAGIAAVTSRTVDFGASDAPLSPDQLAACKGCVVIPWALAGVSLPYNLPGVNARLKLDAASIVGIFDRSAQGAPQRLLEPSDFVEGRLLLLVNVTALVLVLVSLYECGVE